MLFLGVRAKKIVIAGVLVMAGVGIGAYGSSAYVMMRGAQGIVEEQSASSAQVIIVPGAGLKANGTPSDVLHDRLTVALELYNAGRAEKILCSGDNGQVEYDEVNAMRTWLLARDVHAEDIFLDHAGFDTYDTMFRAKNIFGVTSAIVVTQEFHLPRALYLAQTQGIAVQGVSASRQPYIFEEKYKFREIPARTKAFFETLLNAQPTYVGEPLPLTGDGRITWDEGV